MIPTYLLGLLGRGVLGSGGKMRLLRVATCNLNQWAVDFDTNLRNVKESIVRAKVGGTAVRVGPELELTRYGCEDHFLEQDIAEHASSDNSVKKERTTAELQTRMHAPPPHSPPHENIQPVSTRESRGSIPGGLHAHCMHLPPSHARSSAFTVLIFGC